MNCFVYRLRHRGTRMAVEAVTAFPPARGWLQVERPAPLAEPGTHAQLLDPAEHKRDLLPDLLNARVGKIGDSMLVAGTERCEGRTARQKMQTWVVAPTESEAAAMVRALRGQLDVVVACRAELQG